MKFELATVTLALSAAIVQANFGHHSKPAFLSQSDKNGSKTGKYQNPVLFRGGSSLLTRDDDEDDSKLFSLSSNITAQAEEELYVKKRDGSMEILDEAKIISRLEKLSTDLNKKYLNINSIAESVVRGAYQNLTSEEIDILASETAASKSTQHPDYARLAARICVSLNHKITPDTFTEGVELLFNGGDGFISPKIAQLVRRRGKEIDDHIVHGRDMSFTYFGFKTLERSYLLKTEKGKIIERPQYMLMRVALGIHCCTNDEYISKEQEDENLKAAFETYEMMSQGYFTHASPTLFHSGTIHPQLSSCFLVQMSEDSINGIYDTLKRCAVISKVSRKITLFSSHLNIFSYLITSLLGGLVFVCIILELVEHISKELEEFPMG